MNAIVEYVEEAGKVVAERQFRDLSLDERSWLGKEPKTRSTWRGPQLSYVCGRALAMAAVICGLVSAPISARATDITRMPLGMYQATCPDGVTNREAGFTCWEQPLNRPIGSMYSVGDSVPFKGCWNNYDSGINPAWHPNANRQLVYNVGFFPDWYQCPGTAPTLSQAAANAYADHWRGVAQDLINKGYATASHPVIIRPAWEFDGSWYPWGYHGAGDDSPGNYCPYFISAYKHVVDAFRGVSPNFRFVWNPTGDNDRELRIPNIWIACYNGLESYTDAVGLDIYDNAWDPTVDHQQRWVKEDAGALQQIAALSHRSGKPIVIPEWAQGQGGTAAGITWPNDNPEFVNNMAAFMRDPTLGGLYPNATMGWQSYWSGDDNSGYRGWINGNQYGSVLAYPEARAAYITTFKTP
jgi:hypothetical protein